MESEVLKNMNSEAVNFEVCTQRMEPGAVNRLRENLQNFELRSEISQIAKISELASFWDLVSPGRLYKTIQDVR